MDHHHRFLAEQVERGVYATTSAGVVAAVKQMIQDDEARQVMLSALVDEVRARVATSQEAYRDEEETFATAFAAVQAAKGA